MLKNEVKSEYETKLEILKIKNNNLHTEYKKEKKLIENLLIEKIDLEKRFENCQNHIERSESNFAKIKNINQDKIKELTSQLESFKEEAEHLKSTNDSLINEIESLRQEINLIELTDLRNQNTLLIRKISDLEITLKSRETQFSNDIVKVFLEKNDYQTKYDLCLKSKKENEEHYKKVVNSYEKKVETLTETNETLISENKKLNDFQYQFLEFYEKKFLSKLNESSMI